LVDTFELAEAEQATFGFMTAVNAERVVRQKGTPIFVIVGNPPYNSGQLDENDNNRNRKYSVLEDHIARTYGENSEATLLRSLGDPFVKAFRWATERLGEEGIVAFVTNNSLIENIAFDGMRKQLAKDFDSLYVLDLGGNVRKNPKLSGTTHNVFGIQVGVSINIFVRGKDRGTAAQGSVNYARVDEFWKKEQKYKFLEDSENYLGISWQRLIPDKRGSWITGEFRDEYETFLPIASKQAKRSSEKSAVLFKVFSRGTCSNADAYAYNFDASIEAVRAQNMVDDFNAKLDAWRRKGKPPNVEKSFQSMSRFTNGFDTRKRRCFEIRRSGSQRARSALLFTGPFVDNITFLTGRSMKTHIDSPRYFLGLSQKERTK
jgi:predicted helicase